LQLAEKYNFFTKNKSNKLPESFKKWQTAAFRPEISLNGQIYCIYYNVALLKPSFKL